ncbi:MAG: UDP-galactopyranose mutase [Thermodesulfobacteriota bacterium]|nr:UDP-galactopyranose mutase [Thermodesulfobacteriota bacterium]
MADWKYLVVGAGFAGCTLAERIANHLQESVLIVDKRNHIGGNSYDEYDKAGVLVHKYGPHYFRTDSRLIVKYLSQFTEWLPVEYKILSFTNGKHFQFPINLNTWEQIHGRPCTADEMITSLEHQRVPIENPKNSEEVVISQIGWQLYNMFYRNYTMKQWGCAPSELDRSVCARIPIRYDRDDRYLSAKFQALPKYGYHRLFQKMISNPRISILLNTDYRDLRQQMTFKHIFYTGPIDQFYDYQFGPLPYRSLRFEFETLDVEYFQEAMQVNFPNSHAFTRIVEIKHATKQRIPSTTIVREYPIPGQLGDPYYPVPKEANYKLYEKYSQLSARERNTSFVGRLATYRYYNMDEVVDQALEVFDLYCQRNGFPTGSDRTLNRISDPIPTSLLRRGVNQHIPCHFH